MTRRDQLATPPKVPVKRRSPVPPDQGLRIALGGVLCVICIFGALGLFVIL
jgi:hypothetical protein